MWIKITLEDGQIWQIHSVHVEGHYANAVKCTPEQAAEYFFGDVNEYSDYMLNNMDWVDIEEYGQFVSPPLLKDRKRMWMNSPEIEEYI